MKLPLLFVALSLVAACERVADEPQSTSALPRYAFFTWAKYDKMCFALMTEAESHRFIHRWFPKRGGKCGIPELKKALGTLPRGSYVFWKNWPPTFRYPPDKIIDDITQFAESKGLHLLLNPRLD